MTCPTCTAWCATSEKALSIRLKNMADVPTAKPYECPQCGGTDWATSREQIRPEVPKERWWRRAPSWQELRIVNAVAALLCLALALQAGPSVTGMVDTFLVGFNFAAAFYCTYQIRSKKTFDDLMRVCNEMHQMNAALLAGKFAVHVGIVGGPDDDDTPIAPKLH